MRNLGHWLAFGLAAVALAGSAGPAASEEDRNGNVLTLSRGDPLLNELVLHVDGSGNRLTLDQSAPAGAGSANRMSVSVSGNGNGAPSPDRAGGSPVPLIDGLPWGSLTQAGEGNSMAVSVLGSGNLFAFAQVGNGNGFEASIVGHDNVAAVQQIGTNNLAAFSQNGNGNIVSISQRSW